MQPNIECPAGWKKKYFSAEDRENAVIIATLMIKCREIAEQWQKINRPKIMIKTLRTAATFADRLLAMMLSSLEPEVRVKTLAEMNKYRIFAAYNQQALDEYNRIKVDDKIKNVEWDDLYTLCESVLECQCAKCGSTPENYKQCQLWQVFEKYGLPPYDDEAEGCPFKGG
jgi:hypothetical protein